MFLTVDETIKLINEGRLLHIAADESLLLQLPSGHWIGGTTPYFITGSGGTFSKEKLYVNEFCDYREFTIKTYNKDNILEVVKDSYSNGLTLLIMPYASDTANRYSKEAPQVDELFFKPIVGWISGYDLSTKTKARVFNGEDNKSYDDRGIAMMINLPSDKYASLGIINIFKADENGPVIEFDKDAIEANECRAEGKIVGLAEFIKANHIDIEMPLVADYNGTGINVSVKNINENSGAVTFYAPVFKNVKYSFAKEVSDDEESG